MTVPYIVDSIEDHAIAMAPNLRVADSQEIAALLGKSGEWALLQGLKGDVCLTALTPEGAPFMMGGVAPSRFPGAGYVWLLGTDEIRRFRHTFLRDIRQYVDALHGIYPLLHNYVDARNWMHIKWLKWLGCTFIESKIMGVEGRLFHEFVRIKKPCAP